MRRVLLALCFLLCSLLLSSCDTRTAFEVQDDYFNRTLRDVGIPETMQESGLICYKDTTGPQDGDTIVMGTLNYGKSRGIIDVLRSNPYWKEEQLTELESKQN